LRRTGKKKYPIYKIVAVDIRSPRDGRYIEAIGQYNPNLHPIALSFKEERVFHWLRKGARPTDTVRSLLRRQGLWLRWTLMRRGADEAKTQSVMERWQLQQAERATREAERRARRAKKRKKVAPKPEQPAPPAEPVTAPVPS
jgi:small subunit ribosomal protein S16